jgi:RNA polymerase sigma-70 factor (ECF subfamily)
MRGDPLANPEALIQRVYAYAAYRVGVGPDADDVTSETFARALRYRKSYDSRKGEPVAWLLGIARRCVDDVLAARSGLAEQPEDELPASLDLASEAAARVDLRQAVQALDPRDRELIALRYGADLTAKQIAALYGERTNTVEVALHRALRRLRTALAEPGERSDRSAAGGHG